MKKIDLHLHTIPTVSDADFTFSLDKFIEYVNSAELDAVAITNHDIFDLGQFHKIEAALDCIVFPGIEINLDNGHILVISENRNLEEFQIKTNLVSDKIKEIGDSISAGELIQIFGDLNNYLLILITRKSPLSRKATFKN
ncbi:PHP domain-containing protein [Shewanella sp. Iso12]|uniref:PHP domain-containing protein n=1 Tax=Shewanella sp. Iso12 TaxID=1826753 RepID=UPI001C2C7F72|nr:hypothetical protein [Shewanella sp. Iso12]